ncbi:hypothetical protein EON63_22340 [archaeon]|nr:MAG: hypothetical protein EON63_22340 [archaeon]
MDELVPYPDFETLMKEHSKDDWLADAPIMDQQKYFVNWYDAWYMVYGVWCMEYKDVYNKRD